MSTTRILFGLNVPAAAGPGADPVATAVAAEQLGYDFVATSDHPCGDSPTFETWTMLTWMAAATSRIRVASRVLGVPYRNPAMVAKMAETLQRLSGGRLILGLGGGYSDDEFRAFGLPVPSARDKVDGLADAIRIARGLWSQQAFSHTGRVHHTDAAQLSPKPDRPIPIWLGTFGPRALAVTGQLADGWIPSLGFAPPDVAARMRLRMLDAAAAAGRDPGEITCAYHLAVRVQDTVRSADPAAEPVTGPPDALVERFLGFAERGFTAFSVALPGPDPETQRELFARTVIPAVRAAA
ncbi:N5,N10-methylene tetrahydromethanopterin reductase [Actinocatenispora thailandica]|uniref:N5,N10-methylene tetrahydromethanopterin reductase n=1 Tax=Actinocatenispora thailandica TaxID=227318 RepID=A0A7R7HXR2_9ACTN|nr:LLM class flavin-dependent oxidoreductase [Actinocatenispora thailandica]BCJ35408.1 N5,N10-methylene tetrahydromethanopterin reductase [Actinocatenispora thailandica]